MLRPLHQYERYGKFHQRDRNNDITGISIPILSQTDGTWLEARANDTDADWFGHHYSVYFVKYLVAKNI